MVAKPDPCPAAAAAAASPPLNCPRCDSANTKFCYYNNYSLAQPRHFCKSCKRYWTRGGTLRNVPVGGGSRKNKRAKKSHRSAPAPAPAPSLPPPPPVADHSPGADLSSLLYGFPPMINSSSTVFFPKFEMDARVGGGYEENFQDFVGGYSLLSSQIPSQPLLSYDDLTGGSGNRSMDWQVPLEGANTFAASGGSGAAAQSSSASYVFWNQGMSGGWAESGSSVAPLI